MDAPLSLYLTHFRRDAVAVLSMPADLSGLDVPEIEPLSVFDEDDSIEPMAAFEMDEPQTNADDEAEAAIRDALLAAETAHAEQIAALHLSHEAALRDAVDAARAAWVVSESTIVAAMIDTAFAVLKSDLAEGIAGVLRPMLTQAALGHTLQAVSEALDHLVADPEHPTIVLRGPSDLVAAIRDARVGPARGAIERIDYIEADRVEVAIETAGTHGETRLAAALAAIQETSA